MNGLRERSPGSESGVEEFLLHEYDYYGEAFRQSEELGDKRVTSFFTFAAVVVTGLGFAVGDQGFTGFQRATAVAVAALGVLVFGELTVARLIKRNLTSDGYKEAMAMVRLWFVEHHGSVAEYLYHRPDFPAKVRSVCFRNLTKGGWLETMIVTNSVLAATVGAAAAVSAQGRSDAPAVMIALGVAVVFGLLVLWLNLVYAQRRYKDDHRKYLRRESGPLARFAAPPEDCDGESVED